MRDDDGNRTPSVEPDEDEGLPQPDGDCLDVVTTSPEDGRSGPKYVRPSHMRPGGLSS
ncbi:MAG: hypothetical protein FJ098_07730, partial [Deltaproteobacteria bacterium]|nr:hypothetical protein [Deltaproteobacteria bacterium]